MNNQDTALLQPVEPVHKPHGAVATPKKPRALLLFENAQQARDYRHQHGTGGWIFTNAEVTVLFPPDVTPAGIFNHPLTRHLEGKLIGSQ